MSGRAAIPVFDGHNDLLFQMDLGKTDVAAVRDGGAPGHIDLPRARLGGFAGGFFAIFVPGSIDGPSFMAAMQGETYDIPLPDPLGWEEGASTTFRQASHLIALERAGVLKICRGVDEIEATMGTDRLAAVLHIEGAEAIDPGFATLEVLHAAGLRSIGPVWSRPTIFGHGVPMRYPGGPDTGPGLTGKGRDLIRRCNALGIVVDLSHLNEKGFDDVAGITTAPLVATHSNAHALCPSPRNLTDRQLRMIGDSGGMAGLNFASVFLRPDGQMDGDFGLDVMLRHLDHMITVAGEDHVGFGSDFDGALISRHIGDVAGLPNLVDALREHGFDEALLVKLAHGNWMRLLRRTWADQRPETAAAGA